MEMGVNLMLIGLVVMLFCFYVYFKIEDKKEEKKQNKNK